MKSSNYNRSQRGAALIIGLILLAIITLLAVVGMNISNSELASATSEQIRLRAFQAAETGIEHGIGIMRTVPTIINKEVTADPVAVAGSPKDSDGNALDTYTTTIAFRGESTAPGFGANFSSFNYSVASEGKSSRNSVARHETGAYLVNSTNNQQSFGAL